MENEAPERPDRRKQGYSLMRAIMDFGMGIIILGFGILFLLAPRFGLQLSIGDDFRYLFGGLCILYGGFRIYRGARKNYYN